MLTEEVVSHNGNLTSFQYFLWLHCYKIKKNTRDRRMASKEKLDLNDLKKRFSMFAKEREWEQFHTPKNISMALSVEASELMEIFQWLKSGDKAELNSDQLNQVKEELADVLLYAIRLADLLDINLEKAIPEKMEKNAQKYPVEKARGNSKKYTEFT
jgi:dCTP diphosphatase